MKSSPQKIQHQSRKSVSPMQRKHYQNGINNQPAKAVGFGGDLTAAQLHQQLQKQLQDHQNVGGSRNPKVKESATHQITPTLHKNSSSSSLSSFSAQQDQNQKKKTSFNFGNILLIPNSYLDMCFREEDTNYQIYQSMVKRIALSSLNGINGTVFVYGQTGSGKTYSMLGRERKEVIPMLTEDQSQQTLAKKKTKNQPSDLSIANFETNNAATAMNMEMKYLSGRTQEKALSSEQPGILIYALQDLFKEIEEDKEKTYFLRCSYIEIYNEQVYDLLRTEDSLLSEPLHLNEDKNKDFYIRGVIEEPVTCIGEILYYLRRGELNRHYAETKLNHSSSRSHTLFRLQVQSITNNFLHEQNNKSQKTTPEKGSYSPQMLSNTKLPPKDLKKYVTQSVLNFVDLAGSEKVSSHYDNKDPDELFVTEFGDQVPKIDSGVQNRVREGKNINKSLFFLTQVISMRAECRAQSPLGVKGQVQQSHIPYRNSPLTKILRSSLGGNSRTCVVICITPSRSQMEQSLSSLRFGQNAMKIENKVQANIIANSNEEAVKILIADYERKIKSLEKAKKDQQRQREQEMKVIEQLIDEKKRLVERIQQNNMKRLSQLALPDHILNQKSMDQLDGLLIAGVGLVDYKAQPVKTPQSANIETQNITQEVMKVQKHRIDLQQQQIQALLDYTASLKAKYDQLLHDQEKNKDHDSQETRVLKMKERFYEHFEKDYMKQLDDTQISGLVTQFTGVLDLLQKELMKREYRKKLEEVRDQLQNAEDPKAQDNLALVTQALTVIDRQSVDLSSSPGQAPPEKDQRGIEQSIMFEDKIYQEILERDQKLQLCAQKLQTITKQSPQKHCFNPSAPPVLQPQAQHKPQGKTQRLSHKENRHKPLSKDNTIGSQARTQQSSISPSYLRTCHSVQSMQEKKSTSNKTISQIERKSYQESLRLSSIGLVDLPLLSVPLPHPQLQHDCCSQSQDSSEDDHHTQSSVLMRNSCNELNLAQLPTSLLNHQDSFAMTYRESKEQIATNNLFETLQANLDKYGGVIVNSQEYVSFQKNQVSGKKVLQPQTNLQNKSPSYSRFESEKKKAEVAPIQSTVKKFNLKNLENADYVTLRDSSLDQAKKARSPSPILSQIVKVSPRILDRQSYIPVLRDKSPRKPIEPYLKKVQCGEVAGMTVRNKSPEQIDKQQIDKQFLEKLLNNEKQVGKGVKKAGARQGKVLDAKQYQPLLSSRQRGGVQGMNEQTTPRQSILPKQDKSKTPQRR